MKNLQASLETKWFEMTKAKIKPEDYRSLNAHWFARLVENHKAVFKEQTGMNWSEVGTKTKDYRIWVMVYHGKVKFDFKQFSKNIMTKGYPKATDKSRILELEHKGIEIREGVEEWGAEPGVLYFVILHGEILPNE